MIHVKLDPLAARIAANGARRDAILATKMEADAQMSAIMDITKASVQKTQHKLDKWKSTQLKQEMAFARGLPSPTPASPTKQFGTKTV